MMAGREPRAFSDEDHALAICKAIIEQHGGLIDFDRVVGSGSTFYFDLAHGVALANCT